MSRSHRAPALLAALAMVAVGALGATPAVAGPAPTPPAHTAARTSAAAAGTTTGSTTATTSTGAAGAHTTGTSTSSGTTGTGTTGTDTTAAGSTGTTPSSGGPKRPNALAGPPCSTTGTDPATPVICLPADSGEDAPGQVTVGGSVDFAAQIVDNGPAVGAATVVFTLPPQLRPSTSQPVVRIDDWYDPNSTDDGTELACTSSPDGSVYSCRTGALAAGADVLVVIELDATAAATGGSSASFTATLQADPAGAFPSTSVSATVDFLAPARLQVAISPPRASVTVGRRRTLVVSVHNGGAGPAPDTIAAAILASHDGKPHFSIVNAPTLDPGSVGAVFGARRPAAALVGSIRTLKAAPADGAPSFGLWPLGTIAPGATATFDVIVEAHSVGTAVLAVTALSLDSIGNCAIGDDGSLDPACAGTATADLTAVRALPAPAGSGTPIAETGAAHVPGTLGAGLLAVLVGTALTLAGRRRYRGQHLG